MTQLSSLFNHVFGNQPKKQDSKQTPQSPISGIQKGLNTLMQAWLEARSEQAKHYRKHCHIE